MNLTLLYLVFCYDLFQVLGYPLFVLRLDDLRDGDEGSVALPLVGLELPTETIIRQFFFFS